MKVIEYLRSLTPTKGEVGVEIELESDSELPVHALPKGWRAESDGSLRGNAIEYVLTTPSPHSSLQNKLQAINKYVSKSKSQVIYTGRAGVHIHINVQQMEVIHMINFAMLYLILEDILVDHCGKDRSGNLFCLRARDAEDMIFHLEQACQQEELTILNTDRIRYSSLNMKSLFSFGSLEFRAMRSTLNVEDLMNWSGLLLKLKEKASTFSNPLFIAEEFSQMGPRVFAQSILEEYSPVLQGKDGYQDTMYENLRRIQTIIYTGNWKGRWSKPAKKSDTSAVEGGGDNWTVGSISPGTVFNTSSTRRAIRQAQANIEAHAQVQAAQVRPRFYDTANPFLATPEPPAPTETQNTESRPLTGATRAPEWIIDDDF